MTKQTKGKQTVFWWVTWILLTIGSFFLAAWFWTPVIAEHYGTMREARASVMWVVAVFGSWMVLLLPLIILMYSKVDKAYEDARIRREKSARRFRSVQMDRSERLLPEPLAEKLKSLPETMEGGHLLTVTLKDGRSFPHVFVRGRREILGIYGETSLPFRAGDIAALAPEEPQAVAGTLAANWLRLDGVPAPE